MYVFILGSEQNKPFIEETWKHLAMTRRRMSRVIWASPLYVEQALQASVPVKVLPQCYVVVCCLSNDFLNEVFDQPALREMIEGAMRKLPLLIASCDWDSAPSPFANLMPCNHQPLALMTSALRGGAMVEIVREIERVINMLDQQKR